MCIWISKLSVLAVVMLAACVPAGGGGGTGGGARDTAAPAFLGGAVAVVPPAGYCVNRGASHEERDSAVILMGRCTGQSARIAPALITTSIGNAGSASALAQGPQALSGYFHSTAGRTALSRSGDAKAVLIHQSLVTKGGALVLQVEDRVTGPYWRAFFGLRGRLVSISVTPPDRTSLVSDQAQALMEEAMQAMQVANR